MEKVSVRASIMTVVPTPTTTAIRSISVTKSASITAITTSLMTLVALMTAKATQATILALSTLHLVEWVRVVTEALLMALRRRKTRLLVRGRARTSRLSERARTRSTSRVLRVTERFQSVLSSGSGTGLLGRGLLLVIGLVL